MDLYADPPGAKIEHAETMVAHLGGSSANIAVALVQQGCHATLVTRVSNDAIGRFCLNRLRSYNVDAAHVRTVADGHRTSLAVAESTLKDHQCVIYRNGAADFALDRTDIDALDFGAYDAIVITGTVFAASPSREAAMLALDKAVEYGLVRVFDVDYRPYTWRSPEAAGEIYRRVADRSELIVGNDEEFGILAGSHSAGRELARRFSDTAGRLAVYKMGERGTSTFVDGRENQVGVYDVEALKPVGAGDAFMGGLLSGLASGFDLKQSVKRGSASAAIVVASVGCAPAMPDTTTLNRFLEERVDI